MHDVALVEVQLRVADPPLTIVGGFALSMTVGAAAALTVTVAVAGELLPPGPVQINEYAVVAVRTPVP